MNDPHVEKLHYEMIIAEHTDYNKANPIKEETEDFIMSTEGKSVIFSMKKHLAAESDARKLVDNYLKKWGVLIGIHRSPDEIKFRFKKADIIDRAPPLNDSKTLHVKSVEYIVTGMDATLHVSRTKYPDPPRKFKLSPDVETMYVRYKAFRQNREPLNSMAYMCLTILQSSTGRRKGRKHTSKKYKISLRVLTTLAKLSTERGDMFEARKVILGQPLIPHKNIEKTWIKKVIEAIIIRVGEYAYDPDAKFKKITMSDFPVLN